MTPLFLESSTNDDGDWMIFLFMVGGLAQILVGVIQLMGALIRTVKALSNHQSLKKLCIYWTSVAGYFLIWMTLYNLGYNWFFLIPIAWIIAIWYAIMIVFNKKANEE
jgi:hypothetical protein